MQPKVNKESLGCGPKAPLFLCPDSHSVDSLFHTNFPQPVNVERQVLGVGGTDKRLLEDGQMNTWASGILVHQCMEVSNFVGPAMVILSDTVTESL